MAESQRRSPGDATLEITFAYTPCPNDTFKFHQMSCGLVSVPATTVVTHLHDIETLNHEACRGTYDLSKVSFHAWLLVEARYQLLRAGAALGSGCGPLIIARRALTRADLVRCRIAIPGRLTTANLLLQLYAPAVPNVLFTTYDRVFGLLDADEADCGMIIHESRFTYRDRGFRLVADLGAWWERETGLPIPLGCVVARRALAPGLVARLDACLHEAIGRSLATPGPALEYAARHAQETDLEVVRQHVATYVNQFSLDRGTTGEAALAELRSRARDAGVIP
jgi:1,4-dihydroxy-6-naphthoate synthase